MSAPPESFRDHVSPRERVGDRADLIGVANKAIESVGPGWVLGFVLIVIALMIFDHFKTAARNETLAAMITSMEDNRAEEIRRYQELAAECTAYLGRRPFTERKGEGVGK